MKNDVFIFSFYDVDSNNNCNRHKNKKANKRCNKCNTSLQADEKNQKEDKTTATNAAIESLNKRIKELENDIIDKNNEINNLYDIIQDFNHKIDALTKDLNGTEKAKQVLENKLDDIMNILTM